MGPQTIPYHIFPLGDSAITIDFGNRIDININKEVLNRFHAFTADPLPGMIEAIPAYSSLTICYDLYAVKKSAGPSLSAYDWIKEKIQERLAQPVQDQSINEKLIRIPVCYGSAFAPDMHQLEKTCNRSREEIIQLHSARQYKVFMLGFLPGFPYMGEVDERIAMPRKPGPVNVSAGSVGIAGKQTGIYPLDSPGGWQIIGRTPLKLFDNKGTGSTLLKAGDTVQFYSISSNEFAGY